MVIAVSDGSTCSTNVTVASSPPQWTFDFPPSSYSKTLTATVTGLDVSNRVVWSASGVCATPVEDSGLTVWNVLPALTVGNAGMPLGSRIIERTAPTDAEDGYVYVLSTSVTQGDGWGSSGVTIEAEGSVVSSPIIAGLSADVSDDIQPTASTVDVEMLSDGSEDYALDAPVYLIRYQPRGTNSWLLSGEE